MTNRIWELDAARGICILGMLVVHFMYDLVSLYALVDWELPWLFNFVQSWGGVLFLLISGICVTLGSRSVRRGFLVFSFGMVCTAVTLGMYLLGLADYSIIIYFGVLHCLGVCMLLWPVFRKMSTWALSITGTAMAVMGIYLDQAVRVDHPWLIPFGVMSHDFSSADYFPLLPNLGFFLLGAVLGRTVYRNKTSLLPNINANAPILRFLQNCGKHSLWIYLLHQPVLTAFFAVIMLFF